MVKASDNTVSAVNQLSKDSNRFFLGRTAANKRLLILGNSITKHGPKKEIGWENDWGMAASKRENDYVHLLESHFEKDEKEVYIMVRQAATWEREFATDDKILNSFMNEKDFNADVILFRLGENVHLYNDKDAESFLKSLIELIKFLSKKQTQVLFTTCFWKNDLVDEQIKRAAEQLNFPCLEFYKLSQMPGAMAKGQFWHDGVQIHPSDLGMSEIEKAIYPELLKMI